MLLPEVSPRWTTERGIGGISTLQIELLLRYRLRLNRFYVLKLFRPSTRIQIM